jgi:hypothetical protein
MEVEEDVDVIEEGFIAVKDEADIGIKQEEIPEDRNFPDMMAEPDEVSYVFVCVCMSVIRHILPVSSHVSCCDVSMSGQLKQLHCWERKCFGVVDLGRGGIWRSGRVCTKWVCLHVIPEKMEIYSYWHVVKKKKSLSTGCFLLARQIYVLIQ